MAQVNDIILPGTFELEKHSYPATVGTCLHPVVENFLDLDNKSIAARYAALNPDVDQRKLEDVLSYKAKHFLWAGSDIFKVTDVYGHKQMIVVETNSCPSGQKSMPHVKRHGRHNGFGMVINHTFKERISHLDRSMGGLAVIFDKNLLEASGYATTMADLLEEKVHLIEFSTGDNDPSVRWMNGIMQIRDAEGAWLPIRACFRYVTQTPWDRIPMHSKTIVLNPIISCIAGGRNKSVAAIAYEQFNTEESTRSLGVHIRTPLTQRNVTKAEIPALVRAMGGHAVVKVPYSNAGQGVYTITNAAELDAFMQQPESYEEYIVQSLVGRREWLSSPAPEGAYFHFGTRPDSDGKSHVFDIRFMVAGSPSGSGFKPVAIYARKARAPLKETLQGREDSWAMLGTNLSVQKVPGSKKHTAWTTETERLVLMNEEGFENPGLDMDDLIDAYVQTVLSVVAIDRMCERLMLEHPAVPEEQQRVGRNFVQQESGSFVQMAARRLQRVFDSELFKTCVQDNVLCKQIMMGSGGVRF